MTPRLKQLFADAREENRIEHLELVKDIFRIKHCLIAFRKSYHENAVNHLSGSTFDYYYDMDILELLISKGNLSAEMAQAAMDQIRTQISNI